jgi:hypothetical protein
VYQTTAPLYPLLSGALAAVAHLGGSLPFPSSAQLGPRCATAATAIYEWSFHSRVLAPTLRLGYLSVLILLGGVVLMIRALGKGGTRREVALVALIAFLPPAYTPLLQFFHPEDILATGLALAGTAFMLRERWLIAGFMLGLALLSQQFTLLFLVPLLIVAPKSKLPVTIGGIAAAFTFVGLPLLVVTSGRALTSIVIGTGDFGGTNFSFYGIALHSSLEVVFLRLVAIALSALIALWIRGRTSATTLDPVMILALLSLSLALRLYFEVSLFGYYLMPVSVLLLLLEISRGPIRRTYVVWIAVVTWATVGDGLVEHGTFAGIAVGVWQFLIVSAAVLLAAKPLLATRKPATSMMNTVFSQ